MIKTTKFELFNAFLNGKYFTITPSSSMIINKIEREDGSNHSYNIYGQLNGMERAVHVVTVD